MTTDPIERAKSAICDYWEELEEKIEPTQVVTVWFAYILGGWKTLMFIKSYPMNYFEVTYDRTQKRMYLDHYRKSHNKVIPDDSDMALALLREKLSD